VIENENKRKSDIESLQAQINPHFLYNTLDSIIWLAANKKSREILKMTSALSSLLRIGISKGESFIFIKEEIEHIKSYLTIQKMRYNEKLDFTIEVDKSVLELKTLKLILQPLVENSIYHGIKNKEGTGLIEVKCLAAQDHVVFIVKDNGAGMDEDRIQEVFYSSNQAGIGISNVKNRIRLHYGEAYGLTCHSVINEGTTIELRIPRTVDGKSI
jgi:two-component system sensor histidine kinase YesM